MRHQSRVVLVDQHRALPEQAAVALDDQVDRPVEQRMAGRDVLRHRSSPGRDELLLERDPLVPAQQGSSPADLAVAVTQLGRDVGDLEAAWLALLTTPPRWANASGRRSG